MRRISLLSAFLLAAFCNCSSAPPEIHASDYNQSCTGPSDCVVIDEGAGCCTSCGNAAINKSDQAKYQSDSQARQDACKGTPCPAIACIFSSAYCNAGKCSVCHEQSGC